MKPKPFQDATVEAVMRAFKGSGTRRFLVADEPGLGKTLVARQVLSKLSEKNKLTVLYVCANQPIAGQNVDQLLGDLPHGERPRARASADRPGLLPLTDAPSHERLCIYSLTPGTAFSGDKRRHKGRVQERAFACALLEQEADSDLPWLRTTLSWGARNFEGLLKDYKVQVKNKIQPVDGSFARFFDRFCDAMRGCMNAQDPLRNHRVLKDIVDANAAGMRLDVTGWCRNSLAAAALGELKPGLVIFDEFQRFRDLMTDKATARDSAEASIRSILTAKGTGRLLLLSATPYEALRPVATPKTVRHAERTNTEDPATDNDFFRLLEFLLGNRTKEQRGAVLQSIRDAFSIRESEIRRGAPDSTTAKDALADLVSNLSSIMCRTERPVVSDAELHGEPPSIPLTAADMRSFRAFVEWERGKAHAHWAVPLWISVPLAAQTLGNRYQYWKAGRDKLPSAELTLKGSHNWRLPEWTNAKARGLLEALPPDRLKAPWVRPTKRWWPLAGIWSESQGDSLIDGKALVFSRFAAVPGAVSAVVSYSVEAHLYDHKGVRAKPKYRAGAKPTFKSGGASPGMFRLFFVSEFLAGLDPLKDGVPTTLGAAHKTLFVQIRKALRERGVVYNPSSKRRPVPIEAWLVHLAAHPNGKPGSARQAWVDAVVDEEGDKSTPNVVGAAFDAFLSRVPKDRLTEITKAELHALVKLSLSSPAVVLARAVMRHWHDGEMPLNWDQKPKAEKGKSKEKVEPRTPRELLQRLVISGLRRYLDRPWFAATLQRSKRFHKDFSDALHAAVIEGNLENVLDEHFWFVTATNSHSWPKRLLELQAALALSGGRTVLHESTKAAKNGSRVRCNVALPLHQAKDEGKEEAPRPDVVRHAFNTPFWPMVLTTTSVGQEGLDFHPWCKTVAHWDPAPGPVELEQREGRVNRYAGLAIRRALDKSVDMAVVNATTGSPWTAMAAQAEKQAEVGDESGGMSPWWCTPGASAMQLYLHCAGSRESAVRVRLERRRAVYRMVLGASEPHWLIDELDATQPPTHQLVLENSLELGAWKLKQKKQA
ncbi:MAG: hypothetical protein IIZ92_01020 [Aquincola sp.]|nr:hypothetical protein [Aquincola sp.]|tara:strand:- start:9134 stop:12289 length:3156 start_codon:yes stop_codon:yes gene_type:complete